MEYYKDCANWTLFREMIQHGNYVILDTETTGLDNTSEIVQIAIISQIGAPLLDTLVCPKGPIPLRATQVHGIKPEDVVTAPCWTEVRAEVFNLTRGRSVITYNSKYDRWMMHTSDEARQVQRFDWSSHCRWFDAMGWFANWYGEFDGYHNDPRWQPLAKAAQILGVEIKDAHSALGDCLMTLRVIDKLMSIREPSFDRWIEAGRKRSAVKPNIS